MLLAKTQYKTYNNIFLTIIEVFKTYWHYLKSCKYEVFILINHNNLYQLLDAKNLRS